MPGATVMYAAGGHDCREQVRPLFTGIARVEKLAWAMQEVGQCMEQLPRSPLWPGFPGLNNISLRCNSR